MESHRLNAPFGVPVTFKDTSYLLLTQHHYINFYDPKLRIPMLVNYKLTAEDISSKVDRRNCFRKDIRLDVKETSECFHYIRSGYDRGHLAPNSKYENE